MSAFDGNTGWLIGYVITIAVSLVFSAGREALREAMKLIPARGFAPAPSEAK